MLGKLFSTSVPPETSGGHRAMSPSYARGGEPGKGVLEWLSPSLKHKITDGTKPVRLGNELYFSHHWHALYSSHCLRYMNLDDRTIQRVSEGNTPRLRVSHTLSGVRDTLVFCGGAYVNKNRGGGAEQTFLLRYDNNAEDIESFNPRSEATTVVGKFPPLFGHSTDYSPERDALVVFGGIEQKLEAKCDVPLYGGPRAIANKFGQYGTNKARLVFMRNAEFVEEDVLQPTGKPPPPRYIHQSTFANERLFVCGGVISEDDTEMFGTEDEITKSSLFILDLSDSTNGVWSHVSTNLGWSSNYLLTAYKDMVVIFGSVLVLYLPQERRVLRVNTWPSSLSCCISQEDSGSFSQIGPWPWLIKGEYVYVYNDTIHCYSTVGSKKILRLNIMLPGSSF